MPIIYTKRLIAILFFAARASGSGGAGGAGGAGGEGGIGGEGGGSPLTNNETIKIDRGFCSYSPVPTSSNAPWVFVGLSILAARRRNREYVAQRSRQSRRRAIDGG